MDAQSVPLPPMRNVPLAAVAALALALLGCVRASEPVEAPEPEAKPVPRTLSVTPTQAPPAEVESILGAISPGELTKTIDDLVGFGTRHTLSNTTDPKRGIGAAREYLRARMESFSIDRGDAPPLRVAFDRHRIDPDGRRVDVATDVVNVVAVLEGTMPEAAARRYYVIGHYDSRASDPMDRTSDAPGANDDGSGTALVLELARVMASKRFDATIVFMATAGEEQGLLGAKQHARAAANQGIDIRGVLSNDIVGDPSGAHDRSHGQSVRVFSEGLPSWSLDDQLGELRRLSAMSDSSSRQLARHMELVADWHELPLRPRLVFRHDRFLRGGDHTAFNEAGFPAVRLSEVEENYDRQHQDVRTEKGRSYGDLAQFVDAGYLAGVARLNAATLAHLANAPTRPAKVRIVAAELMSDTVLRWEASPEPDVAGYEVVWRDTTEANWSGLADAGEATEFTAPRSKDNFFFGVRAYDDDGYRSPVTFAGVAPQ